MAPIQEHKMILRAVQQGKVKPERIAAALNAPLSHVQSSLTLLDGINPEAVDLLKDKLIAPKAIRCLKKVSGGPPDRNRGIDGQRQQLYGRLC